MIVHLYSIEMGRVRLEWYAEFEFSPRARSTLVALRSLNYTLLYTYGIMDTLLIYQSIPELIPIILWEGSWYEKCRKRMEDNYLETEDIWAPGTWQNGSTKGCIKRIGFESGIPVSKSFSFHFWHGAQPPLGAEWTLGPEGFCEWNQGRGNQYLGERTCLFMSRIKLILARNRILHRGPVYSD